MYKMSVFLLALPICAFICVSTTYRNRDDSKIIYDITQNIEDAAQNGNFTPISIQNALELILSTRAQLSSDFIYWETDMQNNDMVRLDEFLEALRKYRSTTNLTSPIQPNILISIKSTLSSWSYAYEKIIEQMFQDSVANSTPMVSGVSLEFTDYCRTNPSKQTSSSVTDIFYTFTELWETNLTSTQLLIGYEIDINDLRHCGLPSEILQFSDYLIVMVHLFRNRHYLVESYGIFAEEMNKIKTEVSNKLSESNMKEISKLKIYYKIIISASLDTEVRVVCRTHESFSPTISYKQPLCQEHMKDLDVEEEQIENEAVATRYEQLWAKYLVEWVTHLNDSDTHIIQTYQSTSHKPNNDLEYLLHSNGEIIPYLTNLPGEGTNPAGVISAGLLLKSIVAAGFESIMISREKWTSLGNGTKLLLTTELDNDSNTLLTRPIYMLDEINLLNETKISNATYWPTFVLSFAIQMNQYSTPVDIQNVPSVFKQTFLVTGKDMISNETYCSHCQCELWEKFYDIFDYFNNTHFSSFRTLPVFPCYSNITNNSVLIWRETIYLGQDLKANWLSNLALAHKILQKEYSFQKLILHLKVWYIDILNIPQETRASIYCNNLNYKISQFYDALFTWAKLNDFQVIIEPFNDDRDIGNPLAWEMLMTKESRILQKAMKAAPIFVRRRFNQSKVFGEWLQETYPCILKSSNSSIESIKFDKTLTGVTLNLSFSSNGTFLEEPELATILLLVLKQFRNVYMLIPDNYFDLLTYTVTRPSFLSNLKINEIYGNKLYLQVSSSTPNIIKNLNAMTSALKTFNMDVIMMSHILDDINITKVIKYYDQRGIFHTSCNIMAHRIVFERKKLYEGLKTIKYLICDTDPFPATNYNETKMKNFLNSHLYLTKLFQHYYPNIKEIHFRLKPIIVGDNWRQQTENLLVLLSDLNSYAKNYKIHYFLLPAFVQEDGSSLQMGFWNLKNYTNLKEPSSFENIQSKYLGIPTWMPEILQAKYAEETREHFEQKSDKVSEQNAKWDSIEILCGIFVSFFISTSFVIVVAWKCYRKKQGLSADELKEFFNGRQRTLLDAANDCREKNRFFGNIFDGLVYQKEYERAASSVDSKKMNVISNGRFATGYLATFCGSARDIVVKIPKSTCSKDVFKGFLSEVKLLCYLGDHQNIVSFLGCCTKDIQNLVLWIITEYCEMGTLSSYLRELRESETRPWRVQQLVEFAAEIASGMSHIANQNAIHGGLSAKNILLSRDLTCKISGFSLTRKIAEYEKHIMTNQYEKLPWQWLAPESIEKLEFSKKSDVWGYGVTLWEIFSLGEYPYDGVTFTAEFIIDIEKDERLKSPPYATNEIFDVMLECWKREPHKRPEFFNLQEYFVDLTLKRRGMGWITSL